MKKALLLLAVLFIGGAAGAAAQDYTVLHEFAGAPNDGDGPSGTLISDGTMLYGVSQYGGSANRGALFSLRPDGSDFAILHSFTGGANDGQHPVTGLATDGDRIYGTCRRGGSGPCGANGCGVVYSVAVDGSGFTLLHDFSQADGATPRSGVILAGGRLFGTAPNGGSAASGVVYALDTVGSNFTVLHDFTPPADGVIPRGELIFADGKLYGTTDLGGSTGSGTVFSMNTDGSGYTLVHEFGFAPDGARPRGALLSDGTTLYGTTSYGGRGWAAVPGGAYYGTIFSINMDGSGYTRLHDFTGGPSNGDTPLAGLCSNGSMLYGTSYYGGTGPGVFGAGTLFSIETDGSDFQIEHDFPAAPSDGSFPIGGLLSNGSALYGTTYSGGSGGLGVIFSYALPPNYVNLTVSPWFASPGGTVTLSYSCDFGTYGYQGVPVDVYLALIKDPAAANAPSSAADVLGGGTVYFFGDRAREIYTGALRGPTWSGVAFPPVATTGTLTLTAPNDPGTYVLATAFRYAGTTIYVRSDGLPVENSSVFTIW